jgi:hypothetical protein
MSVSSYSKVGAVEQRGMVHSGAGSTGDRNPRTEVGCASIVPNTYSLSQLST